MSKYGYCDNCGSTMEAVGCSNCNEDDVIAMTASWDKPGEKGEDQ